MVRERQTQIRVLDLFSGVGGSSLGAQMAGAYIAAAIDAWDLACHTYSDNFPEAQVYPSRCENVNPNTIKGQIGDINLLIASPECTSHTCARGSKQRSEDSRNTAFQVTRFAEVFKPRWIVIENVVHMRSWSRYQEWLQSLKSLGYRITVQILDSAKFRVPQKRRRLFIICDLKADPPDIHIPRIRKLTPVLDVINRNGKYPFSPLRTEKRAVGTLERADRAIEALGAKDAFLLVYYGTDGSGGWQKLDQPLRTITTVDRFAYVRVNGKGHEMRMLQVPELKKAMGFDRSFKLLHGTRRDRIKLLGNAVCPPVMQAIVDALLKEQ
jgi:DNA (cytosine-5)-methyltransferase 1